MKTLHEIGVINFENNIQNFNHYSESVANEIRDICLYSIGLKNQLEILNVPWVPSPYFGYLAHALAAVVSPLISNRIEPSIFYFILDTESLSEVIDIAPSLETEFRPLVSLAESIKKHFDEDWCNKFIFNELAKVNNKPIKEQSINTIQDLLNLLNQVVVKDMTIDDFRIEQQSPIYYNTDFSTGQLRIQQVKKVHPKFTEYLDCVISSRLTVNKFIEMLNHFPSDTWIKSIRLKGSDNMVYMTVEEDGLVICD